MGALPPSPAETPPGYFEKAKAGAGNLAPILAKRLFPCPRRHLRLYRGQSERRPCPELDRMKGPERSEALAAHEGIAPRRPQPKTGGANRKARKSLTKETEPHVRQSDYGRI